MSTVKSNEIAKMTTNTVEYKTDGLGKCKKCEIINKVESPVTKEIIFSECIKELKTMAMSITKKLELLGRNRTKKHQFIEI